MNVRNFLCLFLSIDILLATQMNGGSDQKNLEPGQVNYLKEEDSNDISHRHSSSIPLKPDNDYTNKTNQSDTHPQHKKNLTDDLSTKDSNPGVKLQSDRTTAPQENITSTVPVEEHQESNESSSSNTSANKTQKVSSPTSNSKFPLSIIINDISQTRAIVTSPMKRDLFYNNPTIYDSSYLSESDYIPVKKSRKTTPSDYNHDTHKPTNYTYNPTVINKDQNSKHLRRAPVYHGNRIPPNRHMNNTTESTGDNHPPNDPLLNNPFIPTVCDPPNQNEISSEQSDVLIFDNQDIIDRVVENSSMDSHDNVAVRNKRIHP